MRETAVRIAQRDEQPWLQRFQIQQVPAQAGALEANRSRLRRGAHEFMMRQRGRPRKGAE